MRASSSIPRVGGVGETPCVSKTYMVLAAGIHLRCGCPRNLNGDAQMMHKRLILVRLVLCD